MNEEMVERIAQAMLDKLIADDEPLAYWAMPARSCFDGYFDLKKLAKVAIAAMREPTQAMENAGNDYDCTPLAVDVWRDMIDAALK